MLWITTWLATNIITVSHVNIRRGREMATIGLMSMHRILNYGSSLQAYSLRRLLAELVPTADLTFLDYRPGTPLVNESQSNAMPSHLGRIVRKVKEYGSDDASWPDKLRFFEHKRTYAKKYFPRIELPASRNYDTDVDLQVIGSDEVFNCVQSNANVGFSRDLFGINSQSQSLISFAASFGNTTLEKIRTHHVEEELAAAFARFDRISVRDENSAHIVESLTGARPPIHLDPTLVFDLLPLSLSPNGRKVAEPYLLVYAYPGRLDDIENAHIRAYAKKKGLKVMCFGGAQPCGDTFVDCSPFELLGYFSRASAVVTDTFHGTIFSVLTERPFATITRANQHHGYGNMEKIGYLLDVLGLRERELAQIQQLESILAQSIDYSSVHQVIKAERQKAREYLADAVAPLQEPKPIRRPQ
ncbi:hypothetical protein CQ019_16770 [Arthrobacter sp. MYb229]|uniref:polysaccharide pyruvyl transferase family protein n=1 Tax=unclassified Arthrobacter TaxID=235627 RepID=UPI000CFB8F2E|nr:MULTISPECIES: polysaccharide pyruvyl transferase family protein [unclassified Arthrobacter]PQZ99202.1 hypothetical protein CQ019_16770 [Arthrobacter sp. MYb229]PRB47587.1 hypothetical protein CQ013_16795 [Arthrobacter sp. MYb216]